MTFCIFFVLIFASNIILAHNKNDQKQKKERIQENLKKLEDERRKRLADSSKKKPYKPDLNTNRYKGKQVTPDIAQIYI